MSARFAVALVVGVLLLVGPGAGLAVAAPCDAPVVNEVACENSKQGSPESEWDVSGAGDASIQGFATDISVNRGSPVQFKVDTSATAYRLDIYRIGYYGGNGARLQATVRPLQAVQAQPSCDPQSSTGLVDCGNWAVSASWSVPGDAVSGVYVAKLVREDGTPGSSHVVFVVRDDASTSDVLFQTSDTTWQAYNQYGGNSLYTGSPAGRAYKVSYNRPFTTREYAPEDWFFNAEYPMVRWLERNGYDVSYTTGVDSDRRGGLIGNHRSFLSVGHDEYWSAAQRANVEAARGAGTSLAFLSGNEVFWKTRWESSIAGPSTANRTLVCYKETHANAKIDPSGVWTGTWRDPRFSPPADGGRPENALTGQLFTVNAGATTAIRVPAAYGNLRLWRNTSIATLPAGSTATLAGSTLGYEWDEDLDNGFRPAGSIQMSSTTFAGAPVLQDYGSTFGSGTAVHHLTLYRAAGGALVFGAGTVQWSWGLDASHDRGSGAADVRMQQATANLLADMGAQAATLQSGLVAPSASTDVTAPTSTIASPASGATVAPGTPITVSGTAADSGGVVAGVEVSVDGGATWRPATGLGSWTFSFTPGASGTATIRSRATDDSANRETPSAGTTITVGSGTPGGSCPCSLWSGATVPTNAAETSDSNAVEVGVKFRPSVAGTITGLRFYKGTTNTGTHVGHLWSAGGTPLAAVTFGGETASGWQQANLSSPVAVTAGTTYVASYHAPQGNYAFDEGYFANAFVNGPLRALSSSEGGGNGVYAYGPSAFPANTFNATNYWVDVVFSDAAAPPDTTPPTVTAVTPADGASGVAASVTPTATFSEAISAATITTSTVQLSGPGGTVAAAVSYDSAARRVTLTPGSLLAGSTAYTMTVRGGPSGVADTAGNRLGTDRTWSFTTTAPPPPDTSPPVVSAVAASATAAGVATVTWSTNESSSSRVDYGSTPASLGQNVTDGARVTAHSMQISGLTAGATYHFRVTSADAAGNGATSPAPPAAPASFVVPAAAAVRVPSAVVIDAGSLRSGTFADLAASDSAYFRTNSTRPLAGTRTSSWYGRMTGVPAGLTSLRVTYAGFNSRSCTQVLQVYRWTTSSWVQIDSRAVSTTQVVISDLSPTGAAANYVSAGEVRVRVRCTTNANFNTAANHLQITYGT